MWLCNTRKGICKKYVLQLMHCIHFFSFKDMQSTVLSVSLKRLNCADSLRYCLEIKLDISFSCKRRHSIVWYRKLNTALSDYTLSHFSESFTQVRTFMTSSGHYDPGESVPQKWSANLFLIQKPATYLPQPKLCITSNDSGLHYMSFKPCLVHRVQTMTELISVMHFGAL